MIQARRSRPLALVLGSIPLAAALLVALALGGCDQSPTGRRQVALVPDGQMAAMGEQTFAEILRSQPLNKDPRVRAYVACVAQAVVDALPESQGEWSIAVIEDPTPNAFALPGGKIGIHTGMLRVARTPDQLAAVIGHEIAHVLSRHGNERLTQELAVQGGLMLVDLLAEEPGGLKHEALRKALGLGAEYGLLLPYSRSHEREADILGRDLMARAGFDPRASLELWRSMARTGGREPLEFLSTHPASTSRIEDLAQGMDQSVALFEEARRQGRRPRCGG